MIKVKFNIGDKVRVDNGDVIGIVTGYTWRNQEFISCEVAWFNNGIHYEVWFAEWRLSHA